MFHVVDFKGCRKRTVVPDTWLNINDTLCLLPPKVSDQELEVLAKNRVEPSEGWQIYGVSSLLTFESYSDAIKRLEELKDTSKADDHQRKRKKPTYLADYHVLDSGVDQPSYTVFETVQDEEDESENEWDPSPSSQFVPRVNKVLEASQVDDHQRKRKKPSYLADNHVLNSGHDQPLYTDFGTMQEEEDESENEWDPTPSPQFVPRIGKVSCERRIHNQGNKRIVQFNHSRHHPRQNVEVKCACKSTCHGTILLALKNMQKQLDRTNQMVQHLLMGRPKPMQFQPKRAFFRKSTNRKRSREENESQLKEDANFFQSNRDKTAAQNRTETPTFTAAEVVYITKDRHQISEADILENIDVRKWLMSYPKGRELMLKLDSEIFFPKDRQLLVRLVCKKLVEQCGNAYPTTLMKERLAKEIVKTFPFLKSSRGAGHEAFYDLKTGAGFIAYRLKTIRASLSFEERKNNSPQVQKSVEDGELTTVKEELLSPSDQEENVVSMAQQDPDEKNKALIVTKLKETMKNRQKEIKETVMTVAEIFNRYPRLKDYKGEMINMEFKELFSNGEKFLEKFESYFVPRILSYIKLHKPHLLVLLPNCEDSMKSLLLLPELLPLPNYKRGNQTSRGSKYTQTVPNARKIPNPDLIIFLNSEENLAEATSHIESLQPYLICVNPPQGNDSKKYLIKVDETIIEGPDKPMSAFDILFKLHYVFNIQYAKSLENFYNFISSIIYEIDTPRSSSDAFFTSLRNISVIVEE